jgi:hypothetical protein
MWTLWLITFSGAAQGAAPAVVTPLAIYQSQSECYGSINQVDDLLRKEYGPNSAPSPGLLFCVSGVPAKR